MQLVEKHIIKPTHKYYLEIDNLCFLSKNLYNSALYNIRQYFFETGKYSNYNTIQKKFQSENQPDYIKLPRKISQQILMLVDKNFKSFFKANQQYKINSNKFKAKPKLPKYKDKLEGRFLLTYTIQAISRKELKNNIIKLSGTDININTKVDDIQQVRLVPMQYCHKIEVIYRKECKRINNANGSTVAIDIGLNNLATVVSNDNEINPFIINGKPLKSINQYYNKKKSESQSKIGSKTSKKIKQLTYKRNNKVLNYLHNASRYLVNHLVSKGVTVVIIGKNQNWKQDINIGKVNNQNFVSIPHDTFINQLKYKFELEGISVIIREESYTSKCSLLDMESIEKHDKYLGRRIHRGLFRSSNGTKINSDVNGGGNIMRKAFPNAFDANGIQGIVVFPLKITPYKLAS